MSSNKSTINNFGATSSFAGDFASLKWTIKNFSLCSSKEGETLQGPEFFSSDATWVLEICARSRAFVGQVAIYLRKIASESKEKTVSYKFSLQDKNGVDHYVQEGQHVFSGASSRSDGTPLIDRQILMEEKKEDFLPNDTLTVVCELNAGFSLTHSSVTRLGEREPSPVCPAEDASLDKLVADFKRIFKKQKYCDVILVSSDDQKFPAHKAILEERSSVFTAMFQHDMVESRSGEVRIEDIDGSTLKHLLHYIYTAKFDEVSDIDISRLYAAADKYNIETLKKKCLRHMLDNLSIDSVCIAIVLADMFKEKQLKESALAFLHKNASSVIKSETWKDFMKEHSYLAAEILETIVLDKKS